MDDDSFEQLSEKSELVFDVLAENFGMETYFMAICKIYREGWWAIVLDGGYLVHFVPLTQNEVMTILQGLTSPPGTMRCGLEFASILNEMEQYKYPVNEIPNARAGCLRRMARQAWEGRKLSPPLHEG